MKKEAKKGSSLCVNFAWRARRVIHFQAGAVLKCKGKERERRVFKKVELSGLNNNHLLGLINLIYEKGWGAEGAQVRHALLVRHHGKHLYTKPIIVLLRHRRRFRLLSSGFAASLV
jgi:hypothetical protein